ncbi:MAG: metallophosphoesterase [Proteobacteria bacterium]|nr:metallophosphoesterase [Pseudomonadota bacterium]MBU1234764.1 metallophosphoesterase [Pseudomonadota bacterium]MBU1419095.1 metallophosphoesterase [Pseudomonadota bacterium]MBU1456565.1 metallophosphoesterase [Pseudomonadota bacterium]
MIDPLRNKLVPITDLQDIRGVKLPVGLNFIQLVVTGPPGAGKTYYINHVHGWPNEGYVDLTRKGWWKDQTLTYRPREVHLGFPFKGFSEALTVFDKEWLEAEEPLYLELERIQIPPASNNLFQTNWRNRYIFEFLLPNPETIFKHRMERHKEGYFPVDKNLTLEMVIRQSAIYREVAFYMHQAKMQVYVREALDKPPMRIAEKDDVNIPEWANTNAECRPDLTTLSGWKCLIFRDDPIEWFTVTDKLQVLQNECRIPHDGKTFEMIIGEQKFVFHPEIPLGIKKKNIQKNWLIATSKVCADDSIHGFARIKVGETVLIGRDNRQYDDIFQFSKCVAKRHLTVTNIKGDLKIIPLDVKNPIQVVRSEEQDIRERIGTNRYNSICGMRQIYGRTISMLSPEEALSTLKEVNEIILNEPYREKNDAGAPGALLEPPEGLTLLLVGDLHAQVDNLLKILTENCLLAHLAANSACVVILGDAVHSDIPKEMEDMDSSILTLDLILKMKCQFPENFFYLLGNHDSFDTMISKNGVSQGVLMRKRLLELRGEEYVAEMRKFYELLPMIMKTDSCVACHAAPPRKSITREKLVNLRNYPEICNEILTNRLKRSHYPAGYDKRDVKQFRKSLQLPKRAPFVVGHTPLDPFNSFWKNAGNIKGHHIIYSGHQDGPSLFIQIKKRMIPLSYPAEPLVKIINEMR